MGEQEYNNRCFVIMPFSTPEGYEKDHFTKIYEQIIKPAVEKAKLTPERVDENLLSTDIVAKIFKGLTECDMAICDLSSRNPNVLYELGIRQAYNKPVLLIKDEKTEKIFDVGGLTTIPYESNRLYENVTDAVDIISDALKEHIKDRNGVIDIIRGRLGEDFVSSEIPTSKEMDQNEKVFSLLTSLVDDIDLIKKQINNDSRIMKNINLYNGHNTKRIELIKMLEYLNKLDSNKEISIRDYKRVEMIKRKINYLLEKRDVTNEDFEIIFEMMNNFMISSSKK